MGAEETEEYIKSRPVIKRGASILETMRVIQWLGFLLATCAAVSPLRAAELPPHYVAHRTVGELSIDGKLDEPSWQRVPWTELFLPADSRTGAAVRPRYNTRAKILWDNDNLYIAADLEVPHVWAGLTRRDTTVYHDDAFEVYIDPDGDTHEYYELSVNAWGTVQDLLLLKPYRDRGTYVQAWDITGLDAAVQVWGTLNDAQDTDLGWSVELALPWPVLGECANRPSPPRDGDTWRLNLSRLAWTVEIAGGGYIRGADAQTWVWSPMEAADMHLPEEWGFVQFSSRRAGAEPQEFRPPPEREARRILRAIYHMQRQYRERHGHFSVDLDSLGLEYQILRNFLWPPRIDVTPTQFEASLEELVDLHGDGELNHWRIRQDSRIWKE